MTTQTPTAIPPTPTMPAPETPSPAPPPSTALADVQAVSAAACSDDPPVVFTLDIRSALALLPDDDALDDWFFRFTGDNEHLGCQFEIDQEGNLIAMASESIDGVVRSGNLYFDLSAWNDEGPRGIALTGNALVRTAGPGRRSPDAGWIAPEQMELLPPPGQRRYGLPFAPRFVAELRSISNSVAQQQAKMEEWLAYGVALGWLIDPFLRQVHIYRPGVAPERLDDPETVSGDPELPGFVFAVRRRIFDLL